MNSRVDFIELGGRGGVFQHTLAAASVVSRVRAVRILTAGDVEGRPEGLRIVSVFSWYRGFRVRPALIVAGFYLRTLPQVIATAAPVTWVQGTFKPFLTLCMLLSLRATLRRVVFSPHNLFSRNSSRFEKAMISLCVRAATITVCYNETDMEILSRRSANVVQLPLLQFVPDIDRSIDEKWKAITAGSKRTILFAGQIRRDKNLNLVMEACSIADLKLIVLGPDTDQIAERLMGQQPEGLEVYWQVEYAELQEICAAMRHVDIVVCPYSVASQSGVAALARAMGTPVAGSGIAGLAAQADIELPSLEPAAIAAVLDSAVLEKRYRVDVREHEAYLSAAEAML